ncbi:MAG: hybrid sensor histidine kinase/response regulator [Mariprofundaceae bacterium]
MDEELLAEFLTESNENLASIEQQLMDLEETPGDVELLDGIFRVIHTVKGSCGFLGLVGLEKVAHAGENLLSKIRSLKYLVNEDIVSLLLECADAIKGLLEGLESSGAEPDTDHSGLINRLHATERLVEAMSTASSAPAAAPAQDDLSVLKTWLANFDEDILNALKSAQLFTAKSVMDAGFAKLREMPELTPADALKILGVAKVAMKKEPVASTTSVEKAAEVKPVAETKSAAEPEAVVKAPAVEAKPVAKEQLPVAVKKTESKTMTAVKPAKAKSGGSIRVDVDLLDSLMNQVGELVLTRNRLMQMVASSGNMEFTRVSRDVDHITEQLQSQLLRTRMQPIQSVWSVVPRIVRDMGKQLDKKIAVIMEGEETELDRTILNALKDPLTHIIRNSCDHGIEMPDARRAAGKPAEGTLRLSASQESGFIVIVIDDDGAGIDADRVRTKAISMGLLTEEQGESISDKAVLQLIFHAGLSTAQKVSNLSGRGVGMDVVRTEIEKVGGNIDISSEPGKGTSLRIRIPLTLAIISAMIVSCENQRFAIPQMSVKELLSAPKNSEEWRLIGGQSFFRLRGKLLPIMRLKETLELSSEVENHGSIVVVDIGDRSFGVLVDEVFGAEEIVVKPLGIHFQHLGFYGGCSILGDGMVIPIFDCNELGGLMQLSQEAEAVQHLDDEVEDFSRNELQHTLVFSQLGRRYAVPMVLIERLECFPEQRIEKSGDGEVLQYRDEVVTVLRWADLIGSTVKPAAGDDVYALMLSDGHRRLCLQVEEVVDILEVPLDIQNVSETPFFLGTTVIEGIATEVVDVFEVVKKVDPNWFSHNRDHIDVPGDHEGSTRKTILFVEDAAFFRNLVIPVLDSLDYEVWIAKDGIEACAVLEDRKPDLILTDLEMPNMNGYALADWVKGRSDLSDVPLVALTATPLEEIAEDYKGKFLDVMMKLDRQSLTEGLDALMKSLAAEKSFSVEGIVVDDVQSES